MEPLRYASRHFDFRHLESVPDPARAGCGAGGNRSHRQLLRKRPGERGMSMPLREVLLLAAIPLGAATLLHAQTAEPTVPLSALKACADIGETSKRVACYDQLA